MALLTMLFVFPTIKSFDFKYIIKYVTIFISAEVNKAFLFFLISGPCEFEGNTYKFLEQFADENCKGWCRCGVNGKVLCVPLCGPLGKTCSKNEVQDIIELPHFKEPRCRCKEIMCLKGNHKNLHIYRPIDRFYGVDFFALLL